MAKTTTMRLVELMVFREDIHEVLAYLGRLGEFQFQDDHITNDSASTEDNASVKINPDAEIFTKLQNARVALEIEDLNDYKDTLILPKDSDYEEAEKLISTVEKLHEREIEASNNLKRVSDAHTEALAFSNLKVPYGELEALSFLTMRIGKIQPEYFDVLKMALGDRAVLVQLGNDKGRIMVACSKKARFFVDTELKKIDFVALEIPEDFKGIPDDAIAKLEEEEQEMKNLLTEIREERANFADTHKDLLINLLQAFSINSQIRAVENNLESTEFVYRITGWLPAYRASDVTKKLDEITKGRSGIRVFLPSEVSAVITGKEKVPVQLKHGKLISNFERMIFSYGSPLYGTIDPTPFVALFFTILFGIMFGDAGQGLVFLIVGILMSLGIFKLSGWEKFDLVFISIGVSSTIMGVLTGEFFANATLLRPFARWVTGFFGTPRDQILPMMPSGDPESIKRMLLFFGFTVGVGFIINTTGLIINIANQFILNKKGSALFGKTGLTGAIFFWYVILFALRVALFKQSPIILDWIIIGTSLFLTAFGEVFERIIEGKRPIMENGLLATIIGAVVEVIEVIISNLSNTGSFVRVGAFALAHAVLAYIIEILMEMSGAPWNILVGIVGNAIVVVLEGMIVAIQVIRLQYYEFFSKFFKETGREFKPFKFTYNISVK